MMFCKQCVFFRHIVSKDKDVCEFRDIYIDTSKQACMLFVERKKR